jgi:parallel beta helix pectate lyase-like protein
MANQDGDFSFEGATYMKWSRQLPWAAACLSFLMAALSPMPAHAIDVTVGCTGAVGSFDYTSITDALNALHAISNRNHTITISGTCTELVNIGDFENLALIGASGAMIFDPSSVPSGGQVIRVQASKNILFQNLTLRGAANAGRKVVTVTDSRVLFVDCTIERGNNFGLWVQGLSHVTLQGSVVQDNGTWGVRVDDSSFLEVASSGTVPTIIRRNRTGLRVNRSRATIFAGTEIRDNTSNGVLLQQGAALFCCDESQSKLLNNGNVGILVETGGKLEMCGPTLVGGNTRAGIELTGSTAKLFCPTGQVISGNGTSGDPLTAGIIAAGNSQIDLLATQITGNASTGLLLRTGSSARIADVSSITGNAGVGASIANFSTLAIHGPIPLSGNGGVDLSCSSNTFASGDKSGIGKMKCPSFESSSEPYPFP